MHPRVAAYCPPVWDKGREEIFINGRPVLVRRNQERVDGLARRWQ